MKDYAELFTNANCCPAVANGRKSILSSEQGQTTQTGEEHKKSLPSRAKTRRVSEMILIRVYWKAPSMVVVSFEFGPDLLPFTLAPPPSPPLLKHVCIQPLVVISGLQVTVRLKYGYSSSFITDSKAGTILDQKPS